MKTEMSEVKSTVDAITIGFPCAKKKKKKKSLYSNLSPYYKN